MQNLVAGEIECEKQVEIYVVCPTDTDPLVWHTLLVNLATKVVEDIMDFVAATCGMECTALDVECKVVDKDRPSIDDGSVPECIALDVCDDITLEDNDVKGGNTFYISLLTAMPTTAVPTTTSPTTVAPTTVAPTTTSPTSTPSGVPTSTPTLLATGTPTSIPTGSPSFACPNALDNDPDSNSCAVMVGVWGGSCANYISWKGCDGFCGLCACSTPASADSTMGMHCSGHGACEASSCTHAECVDAECVCDSEYEGAQCSELKPTAQPSAQPTPMASLVPTKSPSEAGTGAVTVFSPNSACTALVQVKVDPDASVHT